MRRSRVGRNGAAPAVLAVIGVVMTAACAEQSPTSVDEGALPGEPVTIEVEIPWEDFGSELLVVGGYGRPSSLGSGVLANAYAGELDARTLARFGAYPRSASVRDTTGTVVTDTTLSVVGGRFVAYFDRPASTNSGPVALELGALTEAWDRVTATWTHAADSLDGSRAWSQPGGGVVDPFTSVSWDPSAGDSATFVLDSAQVAVWADADAPERGARIDLQTTGERLEIRSVALRLDAIPGSNPDTIVELDVPDERLTFIYAPGTTPPSEGFRVGGAPAWRTVMTVAVPSELNGPPALCDAVGCPVALDPGEISHASLVLTTRASEPAFQPIDSIGIDVRPVLSRETLPKAPLGATLVGQLGKPVGPTLFGSGAGARVEVPITSFVRSLLQGVNPVTGAPRPNTLALLSPFEPLSVSYGSFQGPGSPGAPVLKLIVTIGPSVELP